MVRSLWRSLISKWELATIRMRLSSVSSQAVVTLLVHVLYDNGMVSSSTSELLFLVSWCSRATFVLRVYHFRNVYSF